jgi:hypothetical protein
MNIEKLRIGDIVTLFVNNDNEASFVGEVVECEADGSVMLLGDDYRLIELAPAG